ncbi:MAG: class I SAM-dependent methyltransferase [Ktedonobacteraceae bacterium]|nr:class I SAM-dependent methyltransferase [Ktedonobacteraceae bacterium]
MLAQLFDTACSVSPDVRRFLIRNWFQYLSTLDKEALMTFMNLGYAPLDTDEEQPIALKESDQVNRYCIQMYHRVAGAVDLSGRDVLEVGSGRGGGASYITRYLQPHFMTGVDISKKAVAFCNSYHCIENLRFIYGDAESLPFEDQSFDIIVNIESSYGYGHMTVFLSEVFRVLRPGGYFLFADYRNRDAVSLLRQQLRGSGLTIIKEACINANVLKALDLEHERKLKLIEQGVPKIMQGAFAYFAALRGSKMYQSLKSGDVDYRQFVLCKQETPAS